MPPTRGSTAIIQYIADQGARLDKKDKQGRTALDIARAQAVAADVARRRRRACKGGGGGRGNADIAALLRDLLAKNGIPVPAAPVR